MIINRRWMYIVLGIIAIVMILILTGRKSAHSEIIINSSQEKVWDVLMNMQDYDQWNTVMQLVDGEVQEGNTVEYQFTQDENNISKISAKVVEVSPNEVLNQKGGIPLVLTFNHNYILEDIGEQTKVIIHEEYRGIGVNFWNPSAVEKAYERLNKDLKSRVEE